MPPAAGADLRNRVIDAVARLTKSALDTRLEKRPPHGRSQVSASTNGPSSIRISFIGHLPR
jgi:hypothetical protein